MELCNEYLNMENLLASLIDFNLEFDCFMVFFNMDLLVFNTRQLRVIELFRYSNGEKERKWRVRKSV